MTTPARSCPSALLLYKPHPTLKCVNHACFLSPHPNDRQRIRAANRCAYILATMPLTSKRPHTALAMVFVPQQNEKYYDLGGALGFLSATFVSLYYPALRAKYIDGVPGALPALSAFAPRQLVASAMLGIWSIRLGSFLVQVLKKLPQVGYIAFELA